MLNFKKSIMIRPLMIAALSLASAAAIAAPPTTIVVAFPAGGPGDTLARVMAKELESALDTVVVVENKPGGNGAIAANTVARAAPDGNTLFLSSAGAISINPGLYPKLIYNPEEDFTPISLLVSTPEVLVVGSKSGIKSVPELLEKAKTDRNGVALSTSGVGSMPHMAIAQFKLATDSNILIVPYKGAAPAITDTIGGQVDGFFGDVAGLVQHIKNGGVVPIGLADTKRSAALPDVPTMQELGIDNVQAINWYGIFAPKGTPEDKIESLNAAMRTALKSDAMQEYARVSGLDISPTSPDEFAEMIKSDTDKWTKLIKAENITVD